jgi:hypothetical protein
MKKINNGWGSFKIMKGLAGVLCFMFLIALGMVPAQAKGNKYGLFIGINNYPRTIGKLQGAVNDAKNWQAMLTTTFKFNAADTKLLLDSQATRKNIFDNINAFGDKAGDGDLLVVTYSGHGSLFPDAYSEEKDEKKKTFVDLWFGADHYTVPEDYYDSTIIPVDADKSTSGKPWDNEILDDELYNVFSKITAKGAKVVFISDSCHSGTIDKSEKKVVAKPRFASPNSIFGGKKFEDIKFDSPKNQSIIESRSIGSYLALAGSKDNQVSWDSKLGNSYQGLFSNIALGIIKARGNKALDLTYEQLMNLTLSETERITRAGYETVQSPQLNKNFGDASLKIFKP